MKGNSILPFVYVFSLNDVKKEENNINNFLEHLVTNNVGATLTYLYVEDFLKIENGSIDYILNNEDYLEKSDFTTFDGVIKKY